MNNFFTKVVRKRGGESNPVVIADSSKGGTAYKGGSHLKIPKKGGDASGGGSWASF